MTKESVIRSLLLKTVANGVTAEEESSARRMIEKLRGGSSKEVPSFDTQNYAGLPASEVDWDKLAKKYLNHIQHGDYVNETASAWEIRNKTRLGLERNSSMSEAEYRRICHAAFERLRDRKQIG